MQKKVKPVSSQDSTAQSNFQLYLKQEKKAWDEVIVNNVLMAIRHLKEVNEINKKRVCKGVY